ncbi:MAG: bifunctional biotin--[acetyl-CoA-carboxylase] ligase/biotin operon repressor BirA [Thiohalocapsa sp.]
MDRHLEIVRLLADGNVHSGEAIAARLGISRAAVWKAVRKAADTLGIDVDSLRGRGYRLRQPLELLDTGAIKHKLPESILRQISRIDLLDAVDSTNSWLMRGAGHGALTGSVCLAERQSAGRGRRGRAWVSPFGANIYLSILWRYPLAPAELGGLSLAAGVAVARALETAGARDIGLKWPNDLHWHRRKLAGLLLEVGGESHGPSHVVVGVGVNLWLDPLLAVAINQPWTDLNTVLGGKAYRRNDLVALLIAELCSALEGYGANGLEPFLSDWQRLDAYLGEPVQLLVGERHIDGVYAGIESSGALLLEVDGELRAFHGGEVSVRPRPRFGA